MSLGGVPVSPVSLGGSLRSASGSDPGSFQITVSALRLKVCEICVHLLRVKSLFPTALWFSHTQAILAFKARPSESSSSWHRTPRLESPMWGSGPLLLGRTPAIVIILPFVGCLPGGMGLDCTVSLSLLPISLWFLLYIFSCGKSFLLVLRSFSLTVTLEMVVILVCLCEEVSSWSSYSAILATPSRTGLFLIMGF